MVDRLEVLCLFTNPRYFFFRPSLITLLDKLLETPLTIVEAPMGYGKTTAVREYAKSSGAFTLWKTLDSDSADDFWQGFTHALAQVNRDEAQNLAKLGFSGTLQFLDEASADREIFKETDHFLPRLPPSYKTSPSTGLPDLCNDLASLSKDAKAGGFINRIKSLSQIVSANIDSVQKTLTGGEAVTAAMTAREREIAELAVSGLSNALIGKQLYVSEVTIKKAMQSIYTKLGISNRISLAKAILNEKSY